MRLRTYFALVMALLVLALSIFEYANPSRQNRIGPGTLLVISLLLGLRFVVVKSRRKNGPEWRRKFRGGRWDCRTNRPIEAEFAR